MNEKYDIQTIVKYIIIVLVIVGVFYVITIFVSDNKQQTKSNESEEAIIQYETILISDIFNQTENEYYVLIKDNKDVSVDSYLSTITTYKSKENATKFYYSDLNSAFNKKYIGEINSFEKENFKIKTTVLLKIKDKEINEYYQTKDEISNKLQQISK